MTTETRCVRFFVRGVPAPGGSKRAFVIKGTNRASITEDCKRSKPWRDSVMTSAVEAMKGSPLFEGPLHLAITFVMPRPKGHFGSGKNAGKHSTKPDATKLIRSTEDALKGVVWRDDSQVAIQHAWKVYADSLLPDQGALIEVSAVNMKSDGMINHGGTDGQTSISTNPPRSSPILDHADSQP